MADRDLPDVDEERAAPSASGPPPHERERERLASLRAVSPYVRPRDALMEGFACQASESCEVEVGLVSILEEYEERFLGCAGIDLTTIERASTFCAYAILQPEPLVVEDTLADSRFRDNPFVVGEPYVRFYLGAPILDTGGLPLGSVCAIGMRPGAISSQRLLKIQRIAAQAGAVLETRRLLAGAYGHPDREGEQKQALAHLDTLLRPLLGR